MYCDGIKFVIKLVDAEAIIIKIRAKFVINKLSNFPIISVGLVKILDKFSGSCFKYASTPETINKAKKEKNIKFNNKLKFPLFNSLWLLTYLEKSPKLKITIEKYANIVPATVIKGPKFSLSYKLSESRDTSLTIDERKQSLFGAEVEIPIYQGGKNYSVFRQKKSLKLSRELDYLYKKKEVKKNAANTWSGYSLKKSSDLFL